MDQNTEKKNNNNNDDKNTKKGLKKRTIVIIVLIIVLSIYISIFTLYIITKIMKKRAIDEAQQKVTAFLYDKYGESEITDVKFKSDTVPICEIFGPDSGASRRFVFKYYSASFPDDEFYITLWKYREGNKIFIDEINGDDFKGVNDTCDVNYDDTSLTYKRNMEKLEEEYGY